MGKYTLDTHLLVMVQKYEIWNQKLDDDNLHAALLSIKTKESSYWNRQQNTPWTNERAQREH